MTRLARPLRLAAGVLAGAALLAAPDPLAAQTFYTDAFAYGAAIAGGSNGYIPFTSNGSWSWAPLHIGSVKFSNPAQWGSVEVQQYKPISPLDWALYPSQGAARPLLLTFAGPVYGIGFDFGGWAMGAATGSLRLTIDGTTTYTHSFASAAGSPAFLGVTRHTGPLASVLVERLDGGFTMYDNFSYTMSAPPAPPPPPVVTATPEPASLALFGAGLLALAAVRRRRAA